MWVAAGSFGALAATRFAESLVEGPEREDTGLRILTPSWGGAPGSSAPQDAALTPPSSRGRPSLPPRGLAGAGLAARPRAGDSSAPPSASGCPLPTSPRSEDPLTEELCDFRALIEPHGAFGGLPEPFTLSQTGGKDGTWERVVGPLVLPGGGAFACWRRRGPFRTGWKAPSEYLSRTVVPGLSADEAMRFYLDDARRQRWDTMLQTTEVAWPKADRKEAARGTAQPPPAPGSSPYAPHGEVIRWIRSFPVSFVTPREYVMLRRAWSVGHRLDQSASGEDAEENDGGAARGEGASGRETPTSPLGSTSTSGTASPPRRVRVSGASRSTSLHASKSSPSMLAAETTRVEEPHAEPSGPPAEEERGSSSARVLYAVMRAAPRDERAPPPSRAVRVERMDSTWRCRALTLEETRAEAGLADGAEARRAGGDQLLALVLRELAAGRGAPPPGAPPPLVSETMLLHREDLGVPDRLARMAVKVGMTPVVKAMARAMAEAAEVAMVAKRDVAVGGATEAEDGKGAGSQEAAASAPVDALGASRATRLSTPPPSLWTRARRTASRAAAVALVVGGVLLAASAARSGAEKRGARKKRGGGGGRNEVGLDVQEPRWVSSPARATIERPTEATLGP